MARRKTIPEDAAEEIGKKQPFDLPEIEALVNLVRTHEHVAASTVKFFKSHGITGPQYNVLRILRGHGQPMRTHQVADEMVTREPDITRLLDRLVYRKLVVRHRCPEDRRVVWVELTTAGADLLKSLDRPVRELHRRQLGHLGEQKLRRLSRLLFEVRHPKA